jgi:hypothetical protein
MKNKIEILNPRLIPIKKSGNMEPEFPGKTGTTFHIPLQDDGELMVVSKPKSPLYQRILSWLTFGYYKPTSFSYEVKEVKYEKE